MMGPYYGIGNSRRGSRGVVLQPAEKKSSTTVQDARGVRGDTASSPPELTVNQQGHDRAGWYDRAQQEKEAEAARQKELDFWAAFEEDVNKSYEEKTVTVTPEITGGVVYTQEVIVGGDKKTVEIPQELNAEFEKNPTNITEAITLELDREFWKKFEGDGGGVKYVDRYSDLPSLPPPVAGEGVSVGISPLVLAGGAAALLGVVLLTRGRR